VLKRTLGLLVPAIFAVYVPTCAPAVRPTMPPSDAHMAELYKRPVDVSERDTFHGPWGEERAPDEHATYRLARHKQHGVNPGLTVSDPQGREWHVKQAPQRAPNGTEGPVEVVLSRVLSAVGYHQPPVYFVRSFTVAEAAGTHVERGGRFRLRDDALLNPKREDPDLFDHLAFITGERSGFVEFNYHGWHQELSKRISAGDVVWASELLGQLSDRQWVDAFRAGGYEPMVADRFIKRLHQKIAEGRCLGETVSFHAPSPPVPRRPAGMRR
jgi:hypothetical protein